MFNRNNLPFSPKPAGGYNPLDDRRENPNQGGQPYRGREDYGRPAKATDTYGAPRRRNDYDTVMADPSANSRGYGAPPPSQKEGPGGRRPVPNASREVTWSLRSEKSPNTSFIYMNL